MRTRTRSFLAVTGLAVLALVATACGGSSGTTGPAQVSLNSGLQALNPGTGSPTRGGTLNMLGDGDTDYLDYNISYYTIGYLTLRMFVRGLYAYPAMAGKTTTPAPDLATAAPVVSNGGLTYKVTIKTGAMWNTSPPRQVTAADSVLGLKRACNPVKPFGGLPDFEMLIKGYATFCAGFAKAGTSVAAMKSYAMSHSIAGATASGQTITFTLTQPASYFADELTLPPFNPAPVESLNYAPTSAASYQHTFSDGPYFVKSYVPTKSISFVRNPVWKASTDPIRKAYVNAINVSETGNQTTIQQELQTNTAAASMEYNSFPPVASVPGLVQKMKAGSKDFNLGSTYSTNPYIVFNTVSPNNNKALGNVAVRQAIDYAINRSHLIQDMNGPVISPPLTHILPPGINGAQDLPAGYDPYPFNVTKAKSLLTSAGVTSPLSLKIIYNNTSSIATKLFQTLQSDLTDIGAKVTGLGVPSADFYTKYMYGTGVAQRGVWDLALAGWGPDWYGDAATSFFKPLFYGPASFPAAGGSNYGFYSDPAVTSQITTAASQASATTAATMWAAIDKAVMKDSPIYPIVDPLQPLYHASYVHNALYVPALQNFDPTNVWLSSPF
jgi:peptide/nickel transport system substrate-binding protein